MEPPPRDPAPPVTSPWAAGIGAVTGGFLGAVVASLHTRTWLPSSLHAAWGELLPVGAGLVALGFCLRLLVTPSETSVLAIQRGGLDGDDLEVHLPDRLVSLAAACFFAGLSAWAGQGSP